MQIYRNVVIAACLIGVLSGCASEYPCGEPSAGRCASVSENYDRSFHPYTNPDDVAPPSGFFGGSSTDNKSVKAPINYFGFRKSSQVPTDGAPLVSSPKMIRVWLTSYTDNDNIYHEQAYEYMLADKSHWLYNNNQSKHLGYIKNVSLGQSSGSKGTGNGSFDLDNVSTPKAKPNNNNPNAVLNDFPAINSLRNSSGTMVTTSVGSGIDKTSIIP